MYYGWIFNGVKEVFGVMKYFFVWYVLGFDCEVYYFNVMFLIGFFFKKIRIIFIFFMEVYDGFYIIFCFMFYLKGKWLIGMSYFIG